MKRTVAWGIASNNLLLPYTIRSTRKQAISDWTHRTQETWAERRTGADRVVKLDIRFKEAPDA